MKTKQTTSTGLRPLDPDHQALVEQRKARKPGRQPLTTRDAVMAVQYKAIKQAQPLVIKRLLEGAVDKTDPLHEKCLDIVSKRVMPIAFWESLAKEEFRPDEEKNAAPTINITINGNAGISTSAAGPVGPGNAIERAEPDAIDVTFTEKAAE